jgi:hypothetical protein
MTKNKTNKKTAIKISREDTRDAAIAKQRLAEAKADPTRIISGRKLKIRLEKLLN